MLKHVHSSTTSLFRCSKPIAKDSLSLNSSISLSSGSNTSANLELASSRSSSTCSLHDSFSCAGSPQKPQQVKKVMVKVYARVLCSDIEYKTLCIDGTTSAQQVIMILLQKFKMKHRDPNLYYLTMEVWMRSTGIPIRTIMVLDDEARPAELQACHPKGESKFLLQTRRGGLIKVYDSCLMAGSLYKSLLVSEKTTAEQVVQLVLHCYNSLERPSKFALYLVSHTSSYERMVYPQEIPLKLQQDWPSSQRLAFHLRRSQTSNSTSSTWSTGSTGSNSSASSTLSSESVSSIQPAFHLRSGPASLSHGGIHRATTTAATSRDILIPTTSTLSSTTAVSTMSTTTVSLHSPLGAHTARHPHGRSTGAAAANGHTLSIHHQKGEAGVQHAQVPTQQQQQPPPPPPPPFAPLLLAPPGTHKGGPHQFVVGVALQPSPHELYVHRLRTSRSSIELSSAGSSCSASSGTSGASPGASPAPPTGAHLLGAGVGVGGAATAGFGCGASTSGLTSMGGGGGLVAPSKSQPTIYNPYENCFYI